VWALPFSTLRRRENSMTSPGIKPLFFARPTQGVFMHKCVDVWLYVHVYVCLYACTCLCVVMHKHSCSFVGCVYSHQQRYSCPCPSYEGILGSRCIGPVILNRGSRWRWAYRGADKSLARRTSRCILFDGENISFDASLVTYIKKVKIKRYRPGVAQRVPGS